MKMLQDSIIAGFRKISLKLRHLFLFLALIPLVSVAAEDRELKVKGSLRAPIPQDLKGLHLSSPHAVIKVEVDSEGNLIDIMPVEATHTGLVEKAIEVIEKVTFVPAIVDGEAQGSRTNVYVNFFDIEQEAWRNGGGYMPQGGSVSDALDRRVYQVSAKSFIYGESKVSELDEPLRIVATTLRMFKSEDGVQQHGRCVVEYYVGPNGTIHFPRILEADHDDLGMSALLTLEVTEFEPPRRDGQPTYVKVRQPFKFSKEAS